MDKKVIKKYYQVIELLELIAELNSKYGVIENENSTFISGFNNNEIIIADTAKTEINPDFFLNVIGKLEKLKFKFENNNLDYNILKWYEYVELAPYNEGISAQIEEFWLIIEERKMPYKRTSNRLLKILKKNYISIFEDRITFFPEINELLISPIFDRVYDSRTRDLINNLIELTIKRDLQKAEKIIKKINPTQIDLFDFKYLYEDFENYSNVLKIPLEKKLELEIFYQKYCKEDDFKKMLGY